MSTQAGIAPIQTSSVKGAAVTVTTSFQKVSAIVAGLANVQAALLRIINTDGSNTLYYNTTGNDADAVPLPPSNERVVYTQTVGDLYVKGSAAMTFYLEMYN